jgi:hypothetical protein
VDRRYGFVRVGHNWGLPTPVPQVGFVQVDESMSAHGPAQLDLIRRYARTMREMHADAMSSRRPAAAAPRGPRSPSEPIRQVAKAMTARGRSDAAGGPTLPAA